MTATTLSPREMKRRRKQGADYVPPSPYTVKAALTHGDVFTKLSAVVFGLGNIVRKQYVKVARAKGLSQRRVLYKHIFRNALIPLITGFPAAFVGAFFAGSVLIENLFSLDGLGQLGYEAVIRRDYPVVLGSLYLFTLIGLVVKLVSDLLYVVVDPRVQFAKAAK